MAGLAYIKRPENQDITCVVVGDLGVGKDTLLKTYTKAAPDDEAREEVNGKYTYTYPFKGIDHNLVLLSISGQEKHKRRRKLCYWDAEVFVVCFSVTNKQSYENVKKVWVKEIKDFCHRDLEKDVPIIIVGTQTNKRLDDSNIYIQEEDGEAMVEELDASSYVECGDDEDSVVDIFAEVCHMFKRFNKTLTKQHRMDSRMSTLSF